MEVPALYAFDDGHTPYHENLNNALRAIVELVEEVNALKNRVAELEERTAAPKVAAARK